MEEEEKNGAEKWLDGVGNLIETYRDLAIVRTVEHTSRGAALMVMGILSLVLILCIMIFGGLGAAWWLGEAMQNKTGGFLIVGGTYLLLLTISLLLAKSVIVPFIRNIIIKQIYDRD